MIDTDLFDFYIDVLDKPSNKCLRKVLIEQFIDTALKNPQEVSPELIFFTGELLNKLREHNYGSASQAFNFPSRHEERKIKTKKKQCQIICDVEYVLKNGLWDKGAEGALKLILEKNPYWKEEHSDIQSLQSFWRKAVRDISEWFSSPIGNVDQALKEAPDHKHRGAILAKYLEIVIKPRNPLK